jgi:membrane-bound ClpP family serine protease
MSSFLPATAPVSAPSAADATHDHRQAPVEDRSYRLGSVAAMVSSVCAVHCLVTPLLAGVLPLLGLGFFASELFEWGMLAVAAVVGVIGFGLSFWQLHNNARPFAVFVVGIATLAMTHLMLEGIALAHGAMVIVGAAVIWQAGRMNHALVHACQRCHPHPHRH